MIELIEARIAELRRGNGGESHQSGCGDKPGPDTHRNRCIVSRFHQP
jgi:hypothetical protein